jgi:hypothetical protein
MKILVKNLGPLRQAEFSLGDLTILCGNNNTGKTYATYALFGFLAFWREAFLVTPKDEEIRRLLAEGVVHISLSDYVENAGSILTQACQAFVKQLPAVFASSADRFQDTDFQIDADLSGVSLIESYKRQIGSANAERLSITKDHGGTELVVTLLQEKKKAKLPQEVLTHYVGTALRDVIFGHVFPNPFIASAERTGAAIFRKELNFIRNRLLEEMSQTAKDINPLDLLLKVYQDYPLAVKQNVDFTRNLETISKARSFIARDHSATLTAFSDIIGGEYTVTRNDELYFQPRGKKIKLSMDESSSAVRSLLDIGFYLRHVAQPGDLLVVDEPELNLHPENQCRVARLFARLVNLGIKVFITTHSDYIVKELNTLIMLNHDKPHLKHLAEKEGYMPEELISADRVKVFMAEESLLLLEGGQRKTRCLTLVPADIAPELGIEASSFDKTINRMNRIQEEIVWGGE